MSHTIKQFYSKSWRAANIHRQSTADYSDPDRCCLYKTHVEQSIPNKIILQYTRNANKLRAIKLLDIIINNKINIYIMRGRGSNQDVAFQQFNPSDHLH